MEETKPILTSNRAEKPWRPNDTLLERGRRLQQKQLRRPGMLTVQQFARAEGTSERRVRFELARPCSKWLMLGTRGMAPRMPAWKSSRAHEWLIRELRKHGRGLDVWTIYWALDARLPGLGDERPIDVIAWKNRRRVLSAVLSAQSFHS